MNILKSWNGKSIRFRESDGYGSLTDMANATGKKVNDWLRLKSATEYVQELSSITAIPVDQLIHINESVGLNEERGTYAHLDICDKFLEWCNKTSNSKLETTIRDSLASQINGQIEVSTVCGFVDILTPTEIIEVKSYKNWLKGVGQLMIYGQDFPDHQKRLHLFGKSSENKKLQIISYCTNLNIIVTFDNLNN